MSLRPFALATLGFALFGAAVYALTAWLRPAVPARVAATPGPVLSVPQPPVASARPSPATQAVLGQVLYGRHCQACHGPGGEGGMGPSLRGLRDEAAIRRAITLGRAGRGMPALGARLTSGEVQAVATYVRTL
ncbi:MAG: cytochrome c [Candidatus Sericytochromatia bacterium]|nr:cytochrome c [Candidatus Sericytochromatia bacterium]